MKERKKEKKREEKTVTTVENSEGRVSKKMMRSAWVNARKKRSGTQKLHESLLVFSLRASCVLVCISPFSIPRNNTLQDRKNHGTLKSETRHTNMMGAGEKEEHLLQLKTWRNRGETRVARKVRETRGKTQAHGGTGEKRERPGTQGKKTDRRKEKTQVM